MQLCQDWSQPGCLHPPAPCSSSTKRSAQQLRYSSGPGLARRNCVFYKKGNILLPFISDIVLPLSPSPLHQGSASCKGSDLASTATQTFLLLSVLSLNCPVLAGNTVCSPCLQPFPCFPWRMKNGVVHSGPLYFSISTLEMLYLRCNHIWLSCDHTLTCARYPQMFFTSA